MYNALSSLKLIDVTQIRLHESHENIRLDSVCRSIRDSGFLQNPPLAIRIPNGYYLIVDGAHRTQALQKMGYSKIPVQIVDEHQINMGFWEHIIPSEVWLINLQQNLLFRLETKPIDQVPIAEIRCANGAHWWIYPSKKVDDFIARLPFWKQMVNCYASVDTVNRHPYGTVDFPHKGSILVRFTSFTLEELKAVVAIDDVLPAGVTRFEIEGRLLNVCIPLQYLNKSFEHETWQQWIIEKRERLRYYSRSVYLCE